MRGGGRRSIARRAPRAMLLAALLTTLLASPAAADPAFETALDRVGDDAQAHAARIAAEPDRARAWFYAYVFDLVTPGLPTAERTRIRARARAVADHLADLGDVAPRVVLDGEPDGRLAAQAQAVRAAMDAIRRPADALPLAFDASTTARGVFYGLLHRAALSRRALGGKAEAEGLTEAARRLAAGWLALTGHDELWRALPPAGADRRSLLGRLENSGIAALVAGRSSEARGALTRARQVELSQSGPGPRASFLRGLLAQTWDEPARRLAERQAMLDELGAVGNRWLIARGEARGLQLRLDRGDVDLEARVGSILAVDGAVTDVDIAPILLRTVRHLRTAGAARIGIDDRQAITLLDQAATLLARLREAGVIEATVPADRREQAARDRAAVAARIDLERARLADARGRLDDAWARALAARAALPAPEQAGVDALLARLALERGDLPEAARRAAAADAAAADAALPPAERAANQAVRGRVRLLQGRAAPAFSWANAGLKTVRDAGLADGQRPLRARLHRLAAAALWLDGRRAEAESRLRFALRVWPDVHAALELAGVLLARDDREGARAALSRVADRRTRVAAGCLAADQPRAAANALAGIAGEIADPDPVLTLRAAVCRVWARPRLDGLPAAPAGQGSPRWRAIPPEVRAAVHTLAAEVAERSGGPDAAAQRRAAVHALREALLDGRPRLPRPTTPATLAHAAARLPVDDPESVLAAIGAAELAQRRWRPAPAGPTTDRVNGAVAAVQGRVAAWSRAARRAADPNDADRIAAQDALAAARVELTAALDAQAEAHPAWAALVRPAIPRGSLDAPGPRWIFRVGPRAARLWVLPAAGAPQSYPLPAPAALRALVEGVRPGLSRAEPWPTDGGGDPHAATWRALAAAAEVLVPPPLRETLGDAPIRIHADPPLDQLPFAALVLAPPERPGLAPTFLATGRPVLRCLGRCVPGAAQADASAAGIDMAPADRAAAGRAAPPVASMREGLRAAVAHVGGAVDEQALTPGGARLLIVDGAPPSTALARWAGLAEILVGAPGGDPEAAGHLWARLRGQPLGPALVFTPAAGGAGALLPQDVPRVAEALAPTAAVRRWRLDAMTRAAVPGRVPRHHPAHWARWRRLVP